MSKKQVIPYPGKKNSKKTQIRQMFDGISTDYDLMNRIITGGIDIKWRKNVVAMLLPKKPKKILDVATGTGDLAIALTETNATEIIGIDISIGMLDIGKKKVKKQNVIKKLNLKLEILKKYAILLIISMLLLLLLESEISKISIKDSQKSEGY